MGLPRVRFSRPPGGRQGADGSGVAEGSRSGLEPQQTDRFRVMRRRQTRRPLLRKAAQKTGDPGRVLVPPSVKCHLGFVESGGESRVCRGRLLGQRCYTRPLIPGGVICNKVRDEGIDDGMRNRRIGKVLEPFVYGRFLSFWRIHRGSAKR